MLSAIRRITGKLLLVVLGIAIWQYGDFRESVVRQFRMATAWAATDGTADLKRYGLQLEKNVESLQMARKGLETQQRDRVTKEADRIEELARLDHLLACFRAACLTGLSDGFPQKVFTRSYSEDQIRTTVQELLNRRCELESAGKSPVDELSTAVARMDQRISETKRHIENMPVYEALAIAGDAAGRSTTIMESMTSCLQANQTLLAGPANTSMDSAVDTAAATGATSLGTKDLPRNIDATEFLKPSHQELQSSASETSAPTVSELQNVLRNVVLQSRQFAK